MCTGSLPEVKRPGCGVDHPTPSSAEVKERVELYLNSPSGPSWPVLGWILPSYIYIYIYIYTHTHTHTYTTTGNQDLGSPQWCYRGSRYPGMWLCVPCLVLLSSGIPRNFVGGGVQQIQLRTEDRQNRDLGAVAPLSGILGADVIWYKKFHFI